MMCGSSSSGEVGIEHAGHSKRVAAYMTLHIHIMLSPGTFTVDSIRKCRDLPSVISFQRSEWLDAWALHREHKTHNSILACFQLASLHSARTHGASAKYSPVWLSCAFHLQQPHLHNVGTPYWPWQHAGLQQNSQEQLATDENQV